MIEYAKLIKFAKENNIDLFTDVNRYGKSFYKCTHNGVYKTFSNNAKGVAALKKFISYKED